MESHSETISGTGKRTEILFALETARVPAPAGVTQHFFKLIHVDNSEMVEEGETKLTLFLGRRTVRDPEFAEVPNQVIQSKQRRIYRRKKVSCICLSFVFLIVRSLVLVMRPCWIVGCFRKLSLVALL